MFTFLLENPLVLWLAIGTAILGVGRLSRIITWDAFPPAIAVRMAWARLTNDGPWNKLLNCFWCFTPWLMLFCIGWFMLGIIVTWVAWVWWIFWAWLALSYVSSIILARDEPPNE